LEGFDAKYCGTPVKFFCAVRLWLCAAEKIMFLSRQTPALNDEVSQHCSHCWHRMNKKLIHFVVPKEESEDTRQL